MKILKHQTRTGAAVLALVLTLVAVVVVGLSVTKGKNRSGEELSAESKVTLIRTPNGGIQPQAAVDEQGALHLIYFTGEPGSGDIFYVRRKAGEESFSTPLRVNSQSGSAIATGTIRGAHLAVGKGGRVHVSWMGAKNAEPKGPNGATPMLYARLNDAKIAFEPQRNVMQFAVGLDGGGSVAADKSGNVYVAWHGRGDVEGEANRRVWVARSIDDGRTFSRETAAYKEPTGACGCCGMRAFADAQGSVYLLYRAATEEVNRDIYLLSSQDRGQSFQGVRLHNWKINACPMSSASITQGAEKVLAAWETEGQVYFTQLAATLSKPSGPIAAPGATGKRKHPAIVGNARGETMLVWTEGMGWQKGGSLAWQIFDRDGKTAAVKGEAPGVPVWSLPTAVALANGDFAIIY